MNDTPMHFTENPGLKMLADRISPWDASSVLATSSLDSFNGVLRMNQKGLDLLLNDLFSHFPQRFSRFHISSGFARLCHSTV